MTEKELNDKIDEKAEGIFSKITALFKKHGVIKALILKTGDDKNLDFGEDIQEAGQIVVGTPVTADGKPAEGDYVMPDGTTYVCKGGKVEEIKAAAPAQTEMEQMKVENETLKAQLKEAQDTLKTVQADIQAFKKSITSDIADFKKEPPVDPAPTGRKPFKS